MEALSNRTKTIPVTYPEEYNYTPWLKPQSINNPHRGSRMRNMDTKNRDLNMYQSLHSQSWNLPYERKRQRKTNKLDAISRSSISMEKINRRASVIARREMVKNRPCYGPDPTVPHLKYGIFPKKQQQQSSLYDSDEKLPETYPEVRKTERKFHLHVKGLPYKSKAQSDPPQFVFRVLDRKQTRLLSLSPSTHVDIQPKKRLYSPVLGLSRVGTGTCR